jgi:long-chain-fatty-acid--CoA ligase ACSBG
LIASIGSTLAGCISAGIYATNLAEACRYISDHSRAQVVALEDDKQLAKYATMASSLSHLKAIVVWSDTFDAKLAEKCGVPVYQWQDFLKLGEKIPNSVLEERQAGIKPGHCASLIYTSGTTGPPKAVMISHDNVTWTVGNVVDRLLNLSHEDRFVSYLPLSHIAAQLIDIYAPVRSGAQVFFAQPDALKGTLTVTLKEARPTIFFGVPRVWEKIQEKMVQLGRESTGIKKSLATWAKAAGLEHSKRAQFGAGGGAPWGYGCANSLVLSKIKEALGLDKTKGCFTAAAPIAPETLWYFASLGIPVYEVFGQSECTGPHTVSFKNNWRIGYCGRPISGTVTKLNAGNGELCYKGRHIFMGYMYMPDKTAETIDEEGFLHSGDVAEFDSYDDPEIVKPSGFMKITGRIKELIITAGGENIPPVLIENEFKAAMLAISNAMVIGDRRKFLSILLTLKTEVDLETGIPTNVLAKDTLFVGQQIGSSAKTVEEAKNDPLWIKYINDGMKVANSKTTSSAQIVQKWKLLDTDFSERGGELTPTLKLKRNVAADKHSAAIEEIYAGTD